MGIKQLNKIIKKYAPGSIREIGIHDLKHKTIGIDSAILMYKYRYASQNSTDSHIHGFIQRVCFYLKHGVLPVFVFDGIPPEAKKETLSKRINQKLKIENKIQNLIKCRNNSTLTLTEESVGDHEKDLDLDLDLDQDMGLSVGDRDHDEFDIEEEINKLSKQVTYVTKIHKYECKHILKLLGIPVIEANGEAENTCAFLQKKGIVDYTFTEDTDALTFGTTLLLKSARKLEKVIEIDLYLVLKELKFTMDEFIDFCILCGCDYCPTIPKIGPITALSLVREFSSIENIIENLDEKYTVPDNFDYITARELFNHDPLNKEIVYDFKVKPLQTDKLREFFNEKGIATELCDTVVHQYNRSLNDYNKLKYKKLMSTNKSNITKKVKNNTEIIKDTSVSKTTNLLNFFKVTSPPQIQSQIQTLSLSQCQSL